MCKRTTPLSLLLSCLLIVSLAACDQSSQNIDYGPGSNLTVNTVRGPGFIPNYDSATTAEYQVRAFTVNKEYTWSVSGVASRETLRRDGENIVVSTSTPGSYGVTVTTTVDGEEVSGSSGAAVDYPAATDQAERYGLTVFQTAVNAAGLAGVLNSDAPESPLNGWTAFVPSNEAFLSALDADGNGEIGDAELPAPGVLASVLQYHGTADSLTLSEISSQSVSTLLHPDETLDLNKSAGTVQGTNQTVNLSATDVATSDGVLHVIDGVLLPSAVVSINEQTVGRDTVNNVDTVSVEGTYVADGGFVAIHEGKPSGEIIGVSDELSPGFHGNENPIEITLDSQLSDTTNIVAMPHRDSPDDGQFTFPASGDAPYTRGNSSVPVVDSASVATP
jgi:uncharacterized surface protein with fasciclin (FAS1) repeats